jgi:hypothetical protein
MFYLTRDTGIAACKLFPEKMGIRKYRGCVYFQSATEERSQKDRAYFCEMTIPLTLCKVMFGIVPEEGEAYHLKYDGKKWLKKKVDLAFSRSNEKLDSWPWT